MFILTLLKILSVTFDNHAKPDFRYHTGAGSDLYQIQTLAFADSGIGSH